MTKPTRQQELACAMLAEALFAVTEAARLDGRAPLDAADLCSLAERLARASSAFPLDRIVARALERRAIHLKMPPSAAEMLTLLDDGPEPLELLRLDDEAFRHHVARVEEELGEV